MNTPTNQPNHIATQHKPSTFCSFRPCQPKPKKESVTLATREQKSQLLIAAAQPMAQQVRSRQLISSVLIAAMDWINEPNSTLVDTAFSEFALKVKKITGYNRTAIYRYFDNLSDIVKKVLITLKESVLKIEALTKKERALIDFYGI